MAAPVVPRVCTYRSDISVNYREPIKAIHRSRNGVGPRRWRHPGAAGTARHVLVGWVGPGPPPYSRGVVLRPAPAAARSTDLRSRSVEKRRADGPAVKRKPERPGPKKPMKRRLLTVAQVAADRRPGRRPDRRRRLLLPTRRSTIPDPNADFQTQTTVRLLRRRQDRARPASRPRTASRSPTTRCRDNIKDAVVAAENQSFWTDQGIDPKGILRAAFSNARGNSTQGASTITQQYVKILYLTQERSLTAQAQGGLPLAQAPARAEQGGDPRGLPQHHLLRPRRLRHPGRRAGLLRQSRPRTSTSSRPRCWPASSTTPTTSTRPRARRPRPRSRSATPTSSAAMADTGDITRRGGRPGRRDAAEVPEDRGRQPVRRPEGPHADAWSATSCGRWATPRRRSTAAACGSPRPSRQRRWRRPRQGVLEAEARGLRRQGAPHRGRHRRARHRRAARLLRRPGLPRLPDQLGRRRRHGRLDASSRSRWPPRSRRASPSRTPSRATPPTTFPDGLEVRNEGGGDGNDYGSDVDATYALEESINTAFVDMSASIPDGPEKILETANALGIPPAKPEQEVPRHPEDQPDLSADDALITLGRARSARSTWPTPTPPSPTAACAANVHVIEKVVDRTGEDP